VLTSGQAQGGTLAVSAFFALSGFTPGPSRRSTSVGPFLWHRHCGSSRPIGLLIVVGGDRTARGGLSYLRANVLLVINQHTLGGAFATNPVPYEVNGSLWTLAPEFACYLALAVMPRRWLTVLVPATMLFIAALHLSGASRTLFHDLILSFAVGATLGVARAWIPMRAVLGGGLLAALALGTAVGAYALIAPFVVAYVTLLLAVRLPLRWRADYSYGTYIYAYPAQQALTAFGIPALGLAAYLGCTVIVVGGLAVISWRLIEHPALARGRRRPAVHTPAALQQEPAGAVGAMSATGWIRGLTGFVLRVGPATHRPGIPAVHGLNPTSWASEERVAALVTPARARRRGDERAVRRGSRGPHRSAHLGRRCEPQPGRGRGAP
jgi:peptidoglycan/LPS O-acetylase OafA/YrhL